MRCNFIGIFNKEQLVGIALSQFLNLNLLESFGDRDNCLRTNIRKLVLKNFGSHVLVIGNNMLTGQNGFAFSESISIEEGIEALNAALVLLKDKFKKEKISIHLSVVKDIEPNDCLSFEGSSFFKYCSFEVQPNMVFEIPNHWKTEQDYIEALSKKYRDQYKRAHKRADGIHKQKMDYEAILAHEETIYNLYHHVAQNAPFNTFFLPKNHFSTFKKILKDKFLFYGYFIGETLVGFNTLIKNGATMDTYFLGYDDNIQREKMLYLNMLYDMIAYSINKGFKEIVFARTALEIKSSVGAKPQPINGFVQHSNPMINRFLPRFISYLEPKIDWKERSPFK